MLLRELFESVQFDNWVKPSENVLEREYHIEYELKHLGDRMGDPFPTVDHFLEACDDADIVSLSPRDDSLVGNRSRTRSKEELLSLIRGYRSYPEFRNEGTVEALYDGFRQGKPMELPIVFERNGKRRIFSGNTRLDVAFQMGITPKVMIVRF